MIIRYLKAFILFIVLIFSGCSLDKLDLPLVSGMASSDEGVVLVCSSNGVIAQSNNLQNWEIKKVSDRLDFYDAEYLSGSFLLLGKEAKTDNCAICLYDPKNGSKKEIPFNKYIRQLEVANGMVFAFSDDGISVSKDGINWNPVKFDVIDGDDRNLPNCILYDGEKYILAGGGNFIATSPDLDKWTFRLENQMGTACTFGMAQVNKRLVAVGDHIYMASSTDGIKWTEYRSGENIANVENIPDYYTLCLYDICFGEDKAVAVGQRGLILYSSDGVKWEQADSGIRFWLKQVIWNGKYFVAFGDEGLVYSKDGVKWLPVQ